MRKAKRKYYARFESRPWRHVLAMLARGHDVRTWATWMCNYPGG